MRKISEQELKDILDKHDKWLRKNSLDEWVISEYSGHEYWISNFGSVASIFNSCGSLRSVPRLIKPRATKNGYYTVRIKKKNHFIHRIVADAFISSVKGKIVHHIDGNRSNNFVSNLVVMDHSENNKAGYKTRKLNKKIITEMIRYYRKTN